jgi:hypothetical protein
MFFGKTKFTSLENVPGARAQPRLASVIYASIARNNLQRNLLASATMLRFQTNQTPTSGEDE